jgi:peroxiredoxin
VVVLAESRHTHDYLIESLNRMRILPPWFASVVGVTVLPHEELGKVGKKQQGSYQLLSDPEQRWLRAHQVKERALVRIMYVLDGQKGTVLGIHREPHVDGVNDLVIESVGDWRVRSPPAESPRA